MARHWTENEIPNQTGMVAIVTGANSGIGWDTARALALKGAHVIMACRDLQRANTAADQIKQLNPLGQVEVMLLDLADLASVRSFTQEYLEIHKRLDLLINNAGVMVTPFTKTVQGFEYHFGIHHLGHFALTGLLLDILNATHGARIVTVSSNTHHAGIIDFDNLNSERDYDPHQAYSCSKLANLLFTYELQHRLTIAGKNTLSVAAHPGWTSTNILRFSGSKERFMERLFAQSSSQGALPTLYAAVFPEVQGGEYFGPDGKGENRGYPKKVESSELSHDVEVARRLWTISEELTQVKFRL